MDGDNFEIHVNVCLRHQSSQFFHESKQFHSLNSFVNDQEQVHTNFAVSSGNSRNKN